MIDEQQPVHSKFKNIKIKHFIYRKDGIQIHPGEIDNFKKFTEILYQGFKKYYSFKTEDETSLRVVLKGIPVIMEIAAIQEALQVRQTKYHRCWPASEDRI